MPKIITPLTNTQISSAKTPDREKTLQDGKGLMLLLKPNGAKKWRYRYTHPHTKKRVLLGIGDYPALSLSDARKKRDEAEALIAQGTDPQTFWRKNKLQEATSHINTFEQVAKAWWDVKKTKVSEDHAHDIWRSLEREVLPSIGKLPVKELDATILINSLSRVHAKGALETVRRLCQRINEVMQYATNTGLIPHNPATGIKSAFQAPAAKQQPSITPAELPKLMQDISYASIKLQTRCMIEWQLHTMVRPAEASGTRWDEIDLEKRTWTIPAERMKRKERDHVVPLTDSTIRILELMRPINGHREHVFCNQNDPTRPANSQTVNMALKRMGYHKKLVAHGLRSLASTTLNEQEFNSDVIEAALAHVDANTVRRAYNRTDYLERRRKLMEWWSNHIETCAGGSVTAINNIEPIRRAI